MKDWYIAEDGKSAGPMTSDEVADYIEAGQLTEAGYAYRHGMDDWAPVATEPTFAHLFDSPPPPPPFPPPRSASSAPPVGFAVSRSLPTRTRHQEVTSTAVDSARTPREERIPLFFRRGRRGVVRDVQIREVSKPTGGATEYLSFRLECSDERGNVIEQIPVEMKGDIPGRVLRDGDEVIVTGRRRRHAIKPRAVYVLSTQSRIRPRRIGLIIFAVLVGIVGAILVSNEVGAGGIAVVVAIVLLVIGLWRNR